MGVIVKPLNLNDRQVKRVDRIEESNGPYEGRARRVANRIDARRDARGAENPRLAKMLGAKPAMAQPMKKGGKIIKKAQYGFNLGKAAGAAAGKVTRFKEGVKKAGEDIKQAERNYKTADSLRNVKPKMGPKGFNAMMDEQMSRKEKADSLRKAGRKLEGLESLDYKKGGKIIKKAQNGKKTSFGMLSVKAGVDKNPKPTAADRIAGAKGLAKYGKMMKKGGKCKNGC